MINVTVGTTTSRSKHLYSKETTIRNILEEQGIDYGVSTIMIDGANVSSSDLDKSLAVLGKVEKCMIIAIIKAESAI